MARFASWGCLRMTRDRDDISRIHVRFPDLESAIMRHSHARLVILVLLLAPAGIGRSEDLTLPENQRPKWLSSHGLVMAGSWEPLPFRGRRDGSPG